MSEPRRGDSIATTQTPEGWHGFRALSELHPQPQDTFVVLTLPLNNLIL